MRIWGAHQCDARLPSNLLFSPSFFLHKCLWCGRGCSGEQSPESHREGRGQGSNHIKDDCELSFPYGSAVEESTCSTGDAGEVGSIPGSGRSPREGNGNPLQDSLKEPSKPRWKSIPKTCWGRSSLGAAQEGDDGRSRKRGPPSLLCVCVLPRRHQGTESSFQV